MLKVMSGSIDFGPYFGPTARKRKTKNMENHGLKRSCFLMPKGSKIESKCFPTSMKNLAKTKATFEQLHNVVISHFVYEETELREALGRFVPVV